MSQWKFADKVVAAHMKRSLGVNAHDSPLETMKECLQVGDVVECAFTKDGQVLQPPDEMLNEMLLFSITLVPHLEFEGVWTAKLISDVHKQ